MQKILLLEDILPVALAIQNALPSYNVRAFHSANSFLQELQQPSFKVFLSETDFFILDFDLGDASIVSSSIYKYILENKKLGSILCCISSYHCDFIEFQCKKTCSTYGYETAFDHYLKKDPAEVFNLIEKLSSLS